MGNEIIEYCFKDYEEKDFEILYKIKKEGLKWYVEKFYGEWNEEFQIQCFKDFIEKEKENISIITCENEVIGIFTNSIDENDESVIGLFCIDKKYRGKGIGTQILQKQLQEDKNNGKNTILRVFKENPARFLYQKVGFEIYEETKSHYKMRRKIN